MGTCFGPSITLWCLLIEIGGSILSEFFEQTVELKFDCLHVDQLGVKSLRVELLESELVVGHLDRLVLVRRLNAHAFDQVLFLAFFFTLELIVEVRSEY